MFLIINLCERDKVRIALTDVPALASAETSHDTRTINQCRQFYVFRMDSAAHYPDAKSKKWAVTYSGLNCSYSRTK